jgi:hypothetical protein
MAFTEWKHLLVNCFSASESELGSKAARSPNGITTDSCEEIFPLTSGLSEKARHAHSTHAKTPSIWRSRKP